MKTIPISERRFFAMRFCDVCGELFQWSEQSRLYGSIGHEDCGARQFLVCSDDCFKRRPSDAELKEIIGTYTCRGGGKVINAKWEKWDQQRQEKL